MDRRETEWLNNFNRTVFEELSPYLTPDEKEWLKHKTQSI
jgi:Xaa-Pro aminopeptidase